jgi:hypothetical protein
MSAFDEVSGFDVGAALQRYLAVDASAIRLRSPLAQRVVDHFSSRAVSAIRYAESVLS